MQERIGYGESGIATVYILNEPKILADTFIIEPGCNQEYSSISELLGTPHTISLLADGDYTPLLYQFGYQIQDGIDTEINYFDSSLLYCSFISNIYLPIGDYNIFGNVIDTKSSTVSEKIACSVSLRSYTECIDFKGEIVDPYLERSISSFSKYSFVYQQANNYLGYFSQFNGDRDCIIDSLTEIIDILAEYPAFCESMYPVGLSQAMKSLIDLVSSDQDLIAIFYLKTQSFDVLKELLVSVLDPCFCITENIDDVEDLTLSSDSIVTRIPAIIYRDNDITHFLSVIITNQIIIIYCILFHYQ